jgi:flagellar export protein FliJ
MKRFSFTLETVHNLRERARQEAEAELARASGAVMRAAEELAEARRKREQAMDDYVQTFLDGRLSFPETTLRAGYLVVLAERIAEAERQLTERERECEAARQKLVTVTAAAEATAKLRDHQFARHRAALEREEQQQLDEIAMLKAARQRMK